MKIFQKQLFGSRSFGIFLKNQIYGFILYYYFNPFGNYRTRGESQGSIFLRWQKSLSLRGLIKNACYYCVIYVVLFVWRSIWPTVTRLLSDRVVERSTWRKYSSILHSIKMDRSIRCNLDFLSAIKTYPLNMILASFFISLHRWKIMLEWANFSLFLFAFDISHIVSHSKSN